MMNNNDMGEVNFSIKCLDELITQSSAAQLSDSPIIGISTNHNHIDENTLTHTYCDSIRCAGGIPLIIPHTTDVNLLQATVGRCDGLIMSGGGDVHSLWWGEEPTAQVNKIDHAKDYYDLLLVKCAIRQNVPILGICRGLQLLNVALGGAVIQDISSLEGKLNHSQTATRYELWHKVSVLPQSRLYNILKADEIMVNSFHHQAVGDVAPSGTICATSSDGIIEAVDYYPEYNAMGVQWHPEALAWEGKTVHHQLFLHIVSEARLYRRARLFHCSHITIDSHVDTPSILIGNPCADNELPKVDYNGMISGGLDLAFMAAYVAQGSDEPFEQVKRMLEAVDNLEKSSGGKMVVMKDLSKVYDTKGQGGIMICKAVENGYAIGDDLSRLEFLAERGVKYITLCHNGDNFICDSAMRSQNTHGGLSSFGREVVREMNRLNITIDISHASDETVLQVLKLSQRPIIASHSSCRAIYNHPRNLPDHLLKAIASEGGVVQLCMYHGFLKDKGATIADFVDHIEHALDVIGAQYIGIGTDFDGGGEVIGCRDASDLSKLTMEMMRRGLVIKQLQGIWGANLLKIIR